MGVAQSQTELAREDKVAKVLGVLGISDLEKASKSDIIIALGRLLSLKVGELGKASVHEVTKEVRRALELILQSPLNKEIPMAVYTTPPFESGVLNDVYRKLLKRLLEILVQESSELSPMWRRRLVNLVVENIYNVATAYDTLLYKKQIITTLREG